MHTFTGYNLLKTSKKLQEKKKEFLDVFNKF